MTRKYLVAIIATSMALFHLYAGGLTALTSILQRSIHLMFVLPLVFLLFPSSKETISDKISWHTILLVVLSILSNLYIALFYEEIALRVGAVYLHDLVVGGIIILLVLEATRRVLGWAFCSIAIFSLIYAFFGHYMPGLWGHRGFGMERVISHMALFTDGIYGFPLGVSATYIVLFIIFGALLNASGGGDFFINLATSIFGKFRGGPAKIAIVASSLFSSVSGSAVANVTATGAFTIPLMKTIGYRPYVAGAIEAVASAGGQITPPVMGAVAFVMADFLSISYLQVCLAAAVPAFLYYVALFVMVDLEAAKTHMIGMRRDELKPIWPVLNRGWHLFIPPATLFYLLAVVQSSAIKAAFYSNVAILVVSILRKHTRMGVGNILKALQDGAKGTLQVAVACACAGIIVGVTSLTGIGLKFSTLLINLSGGSLPLLLLITAIVSILLGMGITTTPIYIILAILVAPALISMGINSIAAHLFILYYACLCVITPPVALAAYAAAGIAGSNMNKTGMTACKLGIVGYLVPFLFVYKPALIFQGSLLNSLIIILTSVICIAALSVSIQGYLFQPLSSLKRIFLLASAITLMKSSLVSITFGVLLLLCFLIIEWHEKS